jgi:hypothetical protein
MSSPANTPVEDTTMHSEQVQAAIDDPMRIVLMQYLLAEGEASFEHLTELVSEEIASTQPTDHDRVRAAICLRVDHFPELESKGLISISDEMISLEFLPGSTIRELKQAMP